ncbi:hypothetical protein CJ030_MR6G013860 [Morella rubra]|uniref:Uncharacterized protein n=1 Tax=Morella rubra TaxID=262757 RepID=A0A6A1VET0_9ROSI|nr:hypothetical protein CJ030_MR0G013877 [Morella rubra]KAB1210368.1 hypothetical protein CJ030_MR6G013860 [Morella rubra]
MKICRSSEGFWFVDPDSCCSPLANLLLLADVATKIAEDEEKSKQQRRKRSYGSIQGDSSFIIPKKSKKNEGKVGMGSRKGPKVDVLTVNPRSCCSPLANPLLLADVATKVAEDEEKSKQQRRKRSYGSIQGDSSFMIPKKSKKNEGKVVMGSRKGPKVDVPNVNPNPLPELSEEFKHMIEQMAGTEVTMVI